MSTLSINQISAQFAIGLGVSYTSNTHDIGAQLKSQFSIGNRWRIEASLDGFSTNNRRDFYGDFNVNGNYVFTDQGPIELHALLGWAIIFGRLSSAGLVPPTNSELAQG